MPDGDIFAGFIGLSAALYSRHTYSSIHEPQRFGTVWSTRTTSQLHLALKQLPSEIGLQQSHVLADFTPFAEACY